MTNALHSTRIWNITQLCIEFQLTFLTDIINKIFGSLEFVNSFVLVKHVVLIQTLRAILWHKKSLKAFKPGMLKEVYNDTPHDKKFG